MTGTLSFARWAAGGYASVPAPRAADPARLQTLGGPTMGTHWSLRMDNPRMLPQTAVREAIETVLAQVVAQMSHWAPDSDLSRFNAAPAGRRVELPEALAAVLARASHWAQASGGAFDPTLGALVAAWGFGPQAAPAGQSGPPDAATLARARATGGWQRLALRPGAAGAPPSALQPGGLQLDLSGIAKGHAVDLGAQALQQLGLTDFLFEIGGELVARGLRPGGQPWRVQVEPTLDDEAQALALPLQDVAIATSGDRWHVRAHGRRLWSHTLDPRTGAPAAHALAAVTVLQPRCVDADALATILPVMGPAEGLAFADRLGVPALFTERLADGLLQRRASRAWPFGTRAAA